MRTVACAFGLGTLTLSLSIAAHLSAAEPSPPNPVPAPAPGLESGTNEVRYVATDGNDAWSGALPRPNDGKTDGPFATIDHAREWVRGVRPAPPGSPAPVRVSVEIEGGSYYLAHTLEFTAEDSGSPDKEIVYEAYRGERPVISGGVRVLDWTHVAGTNIYKAMVPDRNFEDLYYNDQRRLRARLGASADSGNAPNVGTYLRVVGTFYARNPSSNCPGDKKADADAAATEDGTEEEADDAADAAPDGGKSPKGFECFDRFFYAAENAPADAGPLSSKWSNLIPPAHAPSDCDPSNGGTAPVGDIQLLIFEQFTIAKLHIACIDSKQHIVYLTGPTNIPPIRKQGGFKVGHRYLVENVRDELKQPGQWFLDRSVKPWVLTYLAKPGEDPSDSNNVVVIPNNELVLRTNRLGQVTFRGLTFANDNFTVPDTANQQGYTSSVLDPNLPAAVSFQNAQDVVLDRITVAHTSGGGLEFISCVDATSPAWCAATSSSAVTAHNLIENSTFYDIGGFGIRIGLNENDRDTPENVPQENIVRNNLVSGFGRMIPTSFGISQGIGNKNLYTHNDVFDGYHVGISICLCGPRPSKAKAPSDNEISFNHVHDTHLGVMNDGGAVRVMSGNGVYTAGGNKILNNKIHDVSSASAVDGSHSDPRCRRNRDKTNLPCDGYGGDGIYLDNQSGLVDVENNLVYRVPEAAVLFPKTPFQATGLENIIKNNILAFARTSMIDDITPYPEADASKQVPHLTFRATSNIMYFDRSDRSSGPAFHVQGGCTDILDLVKFKYTEYQIWDSNLYYRTDGTFGQDPRAFHFQPESARTGRICTHKKQQFLFFVDPHRQQSDAGGRITDWRQLGEDLHGAVAAEDPFQDAKDDNFALKRPVGLGFVPFDPNLAGRVAAGFTPPEVLETFPTTVYGKGDF
jgi:hypothetical protein